MGFKRTPCTRAARYCPMTYTCCSLLPYDLHFLPVIALRPTLAARYCPTAYTCCSLLPYALHLLLVTALRPTLTARYCPTTYSWYSLLPFDLQLLLVTALLLQLLLVTALRRTAAPHKTLPYDHQLNCSGLMNGLQLLLIITVFSSTVTAAYRIPIIATKHP